MSTLTIEPVGNIRGVLAIDYLGRSDCAGIIAFSNDATNTSSDFMCSTGSLTPPRELDATLRAAFGRYDGLLRRLAD